MIEPLLIIVLAFSAIAALVEFEEWRRDGFRIRMRSGGWWR